MSLPAAGLSTVDVGTGAIRTFTSADRLVFHSLNWDTHIDHVLFLSLKGRFLSITVVLYKFSDLFIWWYKGKKCYFRANFNRLFPENLQLMRCRVLPTF